MRFPVVSAALSVVMFALPVTATAATSHTLTLSLPAGAVVHQVFAKASVQTKGDVRMAGTGTVEYDAVIVPASKGYRVTKTVKGVTFNLDDATKAAIGAEGSKVMQAVSTATLQTPPVFTADASLSPQRIENWDDLKAKTTSLMTTMLGPQGESIASNMLGMFDADSAAGAFLKEDRYLAIPRETALALNTPVSSDSETAFLFGGTVKAKESLTLTRWDDAAHAAEYDYGFVPDPASLQQAIAAVVPQLVARMGAAAGTADAKDEVDKVAKSMKVDMATHCHYLADTRTGLITKATCEVRSGVSVQGTSQMKVETYTLSEALK